MDIEQTRARLEEAEMMERAKKKVEELEMEMARLGAELLEARKAALRPEFVEKQERKLSEAWESGRYEHLDLETIKRRLFEARSLRREQQAQFEPTLVVDVKIAHLEAAHAKKLSTKGNTCVQ